MPRSRRAAQEVVDENSSLDAVERRIDLERAMTLRARLRPLGRELTSASAARFSPRGGDDAA
jgi:hypothetical protein